VSTFPYERRSTESPVDPLRSALERAAQSQQAARELGRQLETERDRELSRGGATGKAEA
jgi:hypothetical protein